MCHSIVLCPTCNKRKNCCTKSACRGQASKLLAKLAGSGGRSQSGSNLERGLHPPVPEPAKSHKVPYSNKLLCQSPQEQLPAGGIASAYRQKCSGASTKPNIFGVFQPTIFSPKTQQQMETYFRSDQSESFPQGGKIQNGDTGNYQDVPPTRGVGYLNRFQRRLLPHTDTGTVQEISEISCPGSDISIQSTAFRSVHSTLGVYCNSKGGETDGCTKGYKNPPVPRRLVGEGQNWLYLGAGPKVVQILREGYTLPFRNWPKVTRFPTVISCYANPHRNSYLLEALHQLIDKNAVELVQNQTSGGFQPTIFSPKTQQQMEAYFRSDQSESFPQGGKIQNGDTGNYQDVPPTRGVGYLNRFQRRLLPHTDTGTVQEISEISCPGSDISIQSTAFRSVHSTLGVYCNSKGGETDGCTKGYKNPPVPRRLVGEGHIPPGPSPAYSRASENMPRTGLTGESGKIRIGTKANLRFCRLPVRPQGRSGPTDTGPVTEPPRQSSRNIVTTGLSGPAVHVPNRFINGHRETSSPRPTTHETYTVASQKQLEDSRITRKGDPNPGVAQHALVLGSGSHVQSNPIKPARCAQPIDTALQSDPSQKSDKSESPCMAPRASAIKEQGFSEAVSGRTEAPQTGSSRSVYDAKWSVFTKWCLTHQVDFRAPPVKSVADFLMYLFQDRKLQPSTIDGCRSAIADKLENSSINISKDENFMHLLDSFHRDRPKGWRGIPSWNLSLVLHQLIKAPFEPIKEASLKHLTFKTVFLLALGSGKRRSEIHAWQNRNVRSKVSLYPSPSFLSKNQLAKEGPDSEAPVVIPALAPTLDRSLKSDRSLCPVRALRYYLDRTSDLRQNKELVFVSFKKGFNKDISTCHYLLMDQTDCDPML